MRKLLTLLLLAPLTSLALLDGMIVIKDHTRVGYDDNVFTRTSGNETNSYFVEQIISIDAILSANQRHMLSTMYSPKYVYRDLDHKNLLYHTWISKLQYKPTPNTTIDAAHKWSVSEKEPTDMDANVDITWEQTQSDLTFSHTFSRKYSTVVGVTRKTKEWSENMIAIGDMYTDGDFEQYSAHLHSIYELWHGKLFWTLGLETTHHEYANNRGGFYGQDLYNSLIYVLGKSSILQLDYWYGKSTTVLQDDADDGGGIGPSWKASLNSQLAANLMTGVSVSYETVDSSIAFWNSKDVYKAMVNVKYNITPKIETMAAVVVSESNYLADYDRNGTGLTRKDYLGVVIWNNTYNINRNHAVELNLMGFTMNPHKDAESMMRNKLTLGYRLTL